MRRESQRRTVLRARAERELRLIFGQNVRAERLKRGMSQAELGEECGLVQEYVSAMRERAPQPNHRHNGTGSHWPSKRKCCGCSVAGDKLAWVIFLVVWSGFLASAPATGRFTSASRGATNPRGSRLGQFAVSCPAVATGTS